MAGTPGAALVAGLAVGEGERVLVKKRFSAFFATDLDLILRRALSQLWGADGQSWAAENQWWLPTL